MFISTVSIVESILSQDSKAFRVMLSIPANNSASCFSVAAKLFVNDNSVPEPVEGHAYVVTGTYHSPTESGEAYIDVQTLFGFYNEFKVSLPVDIGYAPAAVFTGVGFITSKSLTTITVHGTMYEHGKGMVTRSYSLLFSQSLQNNTKRLGPLQIHKCVSVSGFLLDPNVYELTSYDIIENPSNSGTNKRASPFGKKQKQVQVQKFNSDRSQISSPEPEATPTVKQKRIAKAAEKAGVEVSKLANEAAQNVEETRDHQQDDQTIAGENVPSVEVQYEPQQDNAAAQTLTRKAPGVEKVAKPKRVYRKKIKITDPEEEEDDSDLVQGSNAD
jgi:hypothetical protein